MPRQRLHPAPIQLHDHSRGAPFVVGNAPRQDNPAREMGRSWNAPSCSTTRSPGFLVEIISLPSCRAKRWRVYRSVARYYDVDAYCIYQVYGYSEILYLNVDGPHCCLAAKNKLAATIPSFAASCCAAGQVAFGARDLPAGVVAGCIWTILSGVLGPKNESSRW